MRSLLIAVLACGLSSSIVVASQAAGQSESSAPVVDTSSHRPAEFAGNWDYNADESVNAATGKPEQAPRSATRGGGRGTTPGGTAAAGGGRTRGAGPGTAGGGTGSGFGGDGGGGGRGGGGTPVGPTADMVRASRDLSRDLMEIPESLAISVTPTSVTFVDDLDRKRTYTTDGKKQKYQLGGSSFDARVAWKDGQLRKDIEGGYGFKMSEVYFLSPDGARLFVILRVGDVKKNVPPTGADRVYDRVK